MLQWNVMWGGGPFRSPQTWAAQRALIRERDPDLIILSELPPVEWLKLLVDELGPGANFAGIEHDPRSRYWFRLCVCSRWPVRLERRLPLPGGVAMSVVCEVRGREVRILVVDGQSNPLRISIAVSESDYRALPRGRRRRATVRRGGRRLQHARSQHRLRLAGDAGLQSR